MKIFSLGSSLGLKLGINFTATLHLKSQTPNHLYSKFNTATITKKNHSPSSPSSRSKHPNRAAIQPSCGFKYSTPHETSNASWLDEFHPLTTHAYLNAAHTKTSADNHHPGTMQAAPPRTRLPLAYSVTKISRSCDLPLEGPMALHLIIPHDYPTPAR